ncbi:hypothetical protein A2U01_0079955, partial [Trifolium medium]|nr:hypothetical protein [Trifolium medium]
TEGGEVANEDDERRWRRRTATETGWVAMLGFNFLLFALLLQFFCNAFFRF